MTVALQWGGTFGRRGVVSSRTPRNSKPWRALMKGNMREEIGGGNKAFNAEVSAGESAQTTMPLLKTSKMGGKRRKGRAGQGSLKDPRKGKKRGGTFELRSESGQGANVTVTSGRTSRGKGSQRKGGFDFR